MMDSRQLAGHAGGWARNWFAKIWKVRGGGLYACGYALTFAYLEIRSIISSLAGSDSLVSFLTEEIIEFFFRFLGDSISNMVQAFIWPVKIVQIRPPVGVVLLVLAFVVFDFVLKKPIQRWLFPESEPEDSK